MIIIIIMLGIMDINYLKKIIFPDIYEEDIINEFEDLKFILHKSKYDYYYYTQNEKTINYKINTLRNSIESSDKLYIMLNILSVENSYIKKAVAEYKSKNNM